MHTLNVDPVGSFDMKVSSSPLVAGFDESSHLFFNIRPLGQSNPSDADAQSAVTAFRDCLILR